MKENYFLVKLMNIQILTLLCSRSSTNWICDFIYGNR